jgi:membrane protease YdiL (CAAX protease family)
LASEASQQVDWEVILVLICAAVTLTIQYYAFVAADKGSVLEALGIGTSGSVRILGHGTAAGAWNWQLARLAYWAVGQTVVYVAAPLVVIKLVFRQRLEDFGAKRRGVLSCWWVYLLLFLAIVPCVIYVSDRPSFQRTYPFYRLGSDEPLWPRFFVWEALYAVQFIGLEFFFRGFLLHGLRRRFGTYSILVMTVPYCMIHFGKPLLETFAAIAAGIILGFMSLKTRSVWLGAVLHIAVAWTMDAAALGRRWAS